MKQNTFIIDCFFIYYSLLFSIENLIKYHNKQKNYKKASPSVKKKFVKIFSNPEVKIFPK